MTRTRPLKDFVASTPRPTTCKLCALPADVLAQIAEARKDRVPRETIVAWLHHDVHVKVTEADLAAHMRERP